MFWDLLGRTVILVEKTPRERFDSLDCLIFFAQSAKQWRPDERVIRTGTIIQSVNMIAAPRRSDRRKRLRK